MISKEQKEKIDLLLTQMTLEEKIGQLNQEAPSIVGSFDVSFEELINMVEDGRISKAEFGAYMASSKRDYHVDEVRKGLVGSLMIDDPESANMVQRIAVEESRLGIPLIIGYDVIHGLKSVYPIPLAEACSFDEDLFERTAEMAAADAKAHGVSWAFGPMLDVARDARWGRVSEGPGEDPYLASVFAEKKIKGLQDNKQCKVAACAKHYVGYSACEGGKDYNTVKMSTAELYNTFLPPFRSAVKAGAVTVMSAFNDLNGVPCTVNKYLLKDVLRNELGFDGFVVTDSNAINECVAHGIAESSADAGTKALAAGIDMDMASNSFIKYLLNAVNEGSVSMEQIDNAVRNVLKVKMWLGLFENPYISQETIDKYREIPEKDRELAYTAAAESMVLLKNEGNVLPIKKDAKISVIGSLAAKKEETLGAWAMSGNPGDCVSVLEGIRKINADAEYYPCCGPEEELNAEEVEKACEAADTIIAVVGELAGMSGEAASKSVIEMSDNQRKMLQMVLDKGKKLIVVLMNGRPMAMGWEKEKLPVILESWHLGIEMGNAVAAVLFGDVNPSGKLSATIPSLTGTCPVYYNHVNTGRPASKSKYTSKYMDAPLTPAFVFGHGLSYTEFEYSEMTLSQNDDVIEVTAAIENVGKVTGTEVVQLYIQDVAASLVRPVKELKAFRRVELAAGEREKVCFSIRKSDMGFYDNKGNYVLESGLYNIYVGTNSDQCQCMQIDVEF